MRFLSTLLASTLGVLLAFGLLFFIGLLFLFALVASSDQTPRVASGSVLVVELDGDIPEVVADDAFARAFGGVPGYDLLDVTGALKKAAVDDRIDAVWLQMRGVNASWATLEEVRRALLDFKQSGKPLVASADDYTMDEAGYYLASTADSVFASTQSLFEFNGFFIAVEFYKNLLDRLDVQPQIVRAGRYKSAVEPFLREDLSPENETQLSAILADQAELFVQGVAEQRGVPPDTLRRLLQDRALLTTRAAHEAGLLDGLLYQDEVEDVLRRRLGLDAGDDLQQVRLEAYARVPDGEAGREAKEEGEIAIVYATGTIVSGRSAEGPFGGASTIGAETLGEALREARDNDRVKAVVLRIDSPGGSASASDAMWREIRRTAGVKPVVVSMGSYAASGGYWIATAADTIVADPMTLTGSIGVFYTLFDVGGLFENKLGVTFDVLRTGPYADLLSGLRPLGDAERALLQRSADETYQTFLQRVSQSRGLSTARVDSLAQGRVWTGADALDAGLVDALGDLDTAVSIAAARAGLGEGPYRTRILPRPRTFVEQMSDALESRAQSAWLHLRTTPTERLALDQLRTLHGVLSDHGTVQARMLQVPRIQ